MNRLTPAWAGSGVGAHRGYEQSVTDPRVGGERAMLPFRLPAWPD